MNLQLSHWVYDFFSPFHSKLQHRSQFSQTPTLKRVSHSSVQTHWLSYRKRKAATLQWQHLWEVKPPNPNDPLFFPATVSAEVWQSCFVLTKSNPFCNKTWINTEVWPNANSVSFYSGKDNETLKPVTLIWKHMKKTYKHMQLIFGLVI